MTIDTALYTVLHNVSAVAALVDTRIYPVRMPQNATYPAIVITQVGEEEITRAMGQTPGGGRLLSGRWQIDVWDQTSATAARALGLAVFNGIDAYDAVTTTPGAVVRIEAIGGGECDYDYGLNKFFASRDYRVWWRE